MKKIILYINSIYDLDNALIPLKFTNEQGYLVYPDFELTVIEMNKYLLIIK